MRDSGCFDFLLRINQPVVMARHGFGDQYRATEIKFDGAGTIKLSFQPEGGGTRGIQGARRRRWFKMTPDLGYPRPKSNGDLKRRATSSPERVASRQLAA